MVIWIDVEDASGNRYGDGPITTASEWQSTRRLDAAGTFAFSMPASDARSNLLANKRIVRCWGADADGVREMGAGIVDRIEVVPGDPTMLRVSGDDLLRELANRTVGDLELFQTVEYSTTHATAPATLTYVTYATSYDVAVPVTFDLGPLPDPDLVAFLYIKHERQFSAITFTLSAVNTELTNSLQLQYYNATDPARPSWEPLAGVVNNTATAGPGGQIYPFAVLGTNTITFDPPSGWTANDDGKYAVRIFDQQVDLDAFTLTYASVSIVEPVSDGLARIMALAPDGWSLDPAGHYATDSDVYMQFSGESVLGALVLLAEQTGEHFTLSPSARRLWWIGKDQEASGLRAVQGSEPTNETMVITGLSQSSDSYDLCTRLYAYGGGIGSGRVSMESATHGIPGYTLGALGAYLEADAAVAIYGRIDRREDFPDIVPADVTSAQITNAANALYDRVYNRLRRQCQLQYAYSLSVVPGKYNVWPGQTVIVDYHEWVDGYHAVNISRALWVLEVTQVVTSQGARTNDFVVATIDTHPNNDYRTVANLIGKVQVAKSVDTPATGYSSSEPGVPVTLDVANGQVVAVGRTVPISSGKYGPIDFLLIQNGLIVAVNPT